MRKPVMQWACRELADGWVMIGVDVDLSVPGDAESLLGYRRAVHPFEFDEAEHPVMAFQCVIAEMTYRMCRGLELEVGAEPHSASRARTFGA